MKVINLNGTRLPKHGMNFTIVELGLNITFRSTNVSANDFLVIPRMRSSVKWYACVAMINSDYKIAPHIFKRKAFLKERSIKKKIIRAYFDVTQTTIPLIACHSLQN